MNEKEKLKSKTIWFDAELDEFIETTAAELRVSFSDIVRMAIVEYKNRKE